MKKQYGRRKYTSDVERRDQQMVAYVTAAEAAAANEVIGPQGSGRPYRSQSEFLSDALRILLEVRHPAVFTRLKSQLLTQNSDAP